MKIDDFCVDELKKLKRKGFPNENNKRMFVLRKRKRVLPKTWFS